MQSQFVGKCCAVWCITIGTLLVMTGGLVLMLVSYILMDPAAHGHHLYHYRDHHWQQQQLPPYAHDDDEQQQQSTSTSSSEHAAEINATATLDLIPFVHDYADMMPRSMIQPFLMLGPIVIFKGIVKMATGIIYLQHRHSLPLTRKAASLFTGFTVICFFFYGLQIISSFSSVFVSIRQPSPVGPMIWAIIEIMIHYKLMKCALEPDDNPTYMLPEAERAHLCAGYAFMDPSKPQRTSHDPPPYSEHYTPPPPPPPAVPPV